MVLDISVYDTIDQYHFHRLEKQVFLQWVNEKKTKSLPNNARPVESSAMIPEKNPIDDPFVDKTITYIHRPIYLLVSHTLT